MLGKGFFKQIEQWQLRTIFETDRFPEAHLARVLWMLIAPAIFKIRLLTFYYCQADVNTHGKNILFNTQHPLARPQY